MSDGALFAIIQNGVRWTGMPAFRGEHSPAETWAIVSFVRRVPRLTAADLAPGPRQSPAGGTAGARAGALTIAMDGTAFVPADATVAVGDTVTWINRDPFPHTVSSRAGRFHSPDLQPGDQWQLTPSTPGRFPYICTLHPGMSGTLIVKK